MTPGKYSGNTLFYGDNLPVLQEYIADESVDLVYLDPPFNSNRSYTVLFKDESGGESKSQVVAYDDAWHWNATTELLFQEMIVSGPQRVAVLLAAMHEFIGANQMMSYLVMMAARLVELHRVLAPAGSLYLHCDPTASHYLKVLLDAIFGVENFRNEIAWKRQSAHSDAKSKFPDVTDTILFYAKSRHTPFKPQYGLYDPEYVTKFYRFDDRDGRGPYRLDNMASPKPRPNLMYEWHGYAYPAKGWRYQRETMQKLHDEGRIYYPCRADGTPDTTKRLALKRYLSEQEGSIITSVWTDIQPLRSSAPERIGYPIQKPLALLERIIQASSEPGDIVLDPFCGCGTAIAAAEKLGRRWIGIDITHLSISLIKYRMKDMFPGVHFNVIGEPQDQAAAKQLAHDNRCQFQWWALSLVRGFPVGGQEGSKAGKKGADKGIDGTILFVDDYGSKVSRILVQVKSGHVKSGDIRDLRGVLEREGAPMGLFITLEPPSQDMLAEAVSAGFYHSKLWQQDFPRIQILTIADLLAGCAVKMPPANASFKQAEKVKAGEKTTVDKQPGLM